MIVTANTWLARTVNEFEAGVAVDNLEPETLRNAIETVITNYAHFTMNAVSAGAALRSRHSASEMVRALFA